MTTAVLAVPYSPSFDPASLSEWERIQLTLDGRLGPDLQHFDLTEPGQGVFVTRGGVRGLGMTKVEHKRDRSPAVAGAFWRGLSYEPREIFMPLHLWSDFGTRAWVERDRAFWDAVHPEHEFTLTLRVPGVSQRSLKCRLTSDSDWQPDMDPTYFGWATYGLLAQADQPFWEGAVQTLPWQAPNPVPFHGGLNPGDPIIRISSGLSYANATITNPGDVEAYPVWTIYGPCTTASISVDGRVIQVPITLTTGQSIVIDTRPTAQTAYKGTVDVFSQLGQINFAPIPKGQTATLLLTMSGTGTFGAELTPLHFKPW